MEEVYRRRRTAMSLLAGALLAIGGCRWHGQCDVDRCADVPRGAIPQPAGTYACQWQTEQMARAEADDFVVYLNEWRDGGRELGPYGQRHLEIIAWRLPAVPFAVVIEPRFDLATNAFDAELNDARRQVLIEHLLQAGIADAEARVVVGYPEAEGLTGEEGARLGQRMYGIRSGGNGGGGFGGGSDFGGLSGSLGGGY